MNRKFTRCLTLMAWVVIPILLAVLAFPLAAVMDNDAALAAPDGLAIEVAPGSELASPVALQEDLLMGSVLAGADRTIEGAGVMPSAMLDSQTGPRPAPGWLNNLHNLSVGVLILSTLTALVVAHKSLCFRLSHYLHGNLKAREPRGGAANRFIMLA